jgi:hypothetical protein
VAEVNTGLQQLFHGNRNQTKLSFSLIGLMYSPQPLDLLSNQSCYGNGINRTYKSNMSYRFEN